MHDHLARAQLLISQSRYDLAEQELGRFLAEDPEDPAGHALLALCLSERGEHHRALEEARLAVATAPDDPAFHHILAAIHHDQDDGVAAETAIREAIRLDPEDADHFAVLSGALSLQRKWQDALAAAEQGLAAEPEHTGNINLRAHALTMLGRTEEAGLSLDTALHHDPHNASTHANRGWQQLHQGDHTGAMASFREALRLDANSDWARQGIIEALKARNPIYRLMLRYFLWMSRLSGRTKWFVILGAFFGYRIVRGVARSNPELAPFLQPILILYLVFVFMSWIASPLFNLLLRLHPFGRLALSAEEIRAANLIGLLLALALVSLGFMLATDSALALRSLIVSAGMLFPVAGYFEISEKRRRRMGWFIFALAAIGVVTLTLTAVGIDAAGGLFLLFILGVIASMWITNAMLIRD